MSLDVILDTTRYRDKELEGYKIVRKVGRGAYRSRIFHSNYRLGETYKSASQVMNHLHYSPGFHIYTADLLAIKDLLIKYSEADRLYKSCIVKVSGKDVLARGEEKVVFYPELLRPHVLLKPDRLFVPITVCHVMTITEEIEVKGGI